MFKHKFMGILLTYIYLKKTIYLFRSGNIKIKL